MHTSRLVLRCFLSACWILVNAIYRVIQRVVWSFNGTASELRVRARPEQYENSAQVMRILFRFKFDEYLIPANVNNDFILLHERFDSPEYVLQDHVTLYQVTKKEAIFIEAPPGNELWRGREYNPFMVASQFMFGRKVVRIPISSFWRLADSLGDPKGQLVFLANTARCGSTLLAQMFEVTNKIVAISEPSALNVLSSKITWKQTTTDDLKRLVIATVRVLCKPTSNGELAYVLKLTAQSTQGLPLVAEVFPKARHLFMYRDSLKVAQSMYRFSEEVPGAKILSLLYKWRYSPIRYHLEAMGVPTDAFKFTITSDLSLGTIAWGWTVKLYEQFRDAGVDIAAVRYEDIVERPAEAMTAILRHLDLPENLALTAKSALEWDSQRDTPLAISVLRRHRTVEYSGRNKAECDQICDSIGVPHHGQPYIAPGTITTK